jgi:ATP-binding cassette subfamily C (CFTR/MRP) protein 1
MAFDDSQKVLLESGSFSGYRPLRELGSGYLTGSAFKQPLCGNEEGWGPLSPHRYDFTPCFIDVWIASVAVFGLVIGSLAVWWLLVKKEHNEAQSKNWHFYIKQVWCNNILYHLQLTTPN